MELIEFVKNFAFQFEDTDESIINADTVFMELDEWSSLTALGVIAFVKTEYGKSISGTQIRSCNTVKDLFEFVKALP
jgi:acyl carrier protein